MKPEPPPPRITRRQLLPTVLFSAAALQSIRLPALNAADSAPTLADAFKGAPIQFNTRAAARVAAIPISAQCVLLAGYYSAGDCGLVPYRRLLSAPTVQRGWHFQSADGAWWQMAPMPYVDIRAFGAKGDGSSNDTAAVREFFSALAALGVAGHISAGRYSVDPVTLSGLHGLQVAGAGVEKAYFFPRTAAQPHVLWIDNTCRDLHFDGFHVFGAEQPPGSRPQHGIIWEAVQAHCGHLAVSGCVNGFWLRRGGYATFEKLDLFGCSGSYLKTGGQATVGGQAANVLFRQILIDGQYGGPEVNATNYPAVAASVPGIGLDIDSYSAYLFFENVTGAGTQHGILIHDSVSRDKWNAMHTRPDGIYLDYINFDWGGGVQFQVNSAALVVVREAWLRSIGTAAALVQGFANLHLRNFNAYASVGTGLRIVGSYGELTISNPGIVGNGWPANSGGVNLHLAGGAGRVTINGGQIANPNAAVSDYPVLNVTNTADRMLVVEKAFTGNLVVNGCSLRNAKIAATSGVIGRDKTTMIDCEGLVLSKSGFLSAATDAAGHVSIPHGLKNGPLAIAPRAAFATVNAMGRFATVISMDTNHLKILVSDGMGKPVASASLNFHWGAEV